MKKLFLVLIAFSFLFVGCNFKTKVTKEQMDGGRYEYIEFWNGGGMMRRYENATLEIQIATSTKAVGKDVYFYKYYVRGTIDGVQTSEVIIDSEALSYLYKVQR